MSQFDFALGFNKKATRLLIIFQSSPELVVWWQHKADQMWPLRAAADQRPLSRSSDHSWPIRGKMWPLRARSWVSKSANYWMKTAATSSADKCRLHNSLVWSLSSLLYTSPCILFSWLSSAKSRSLIRVWRNGLRLGQLIIKLPCSLLYIFSLILFSWLSSAQSRSLIRVWTNGPGPERLIIKNAKWYYLSIFGMGRVDLTWNFFLITFLGQ